ncbi:hypothetical protein CHS0354_027996 [Potamilus streckersoni]|uniref:Uncharacterized protein n=1 Tax=Potamilus streckersoni TaxID=2493646 RepID=A0AAE0W756_9BIVA|nr:hypothetical protein CHS0354_027996 [Potamilus streckersoni]
MGEDDRNGVELLLNTKLNDSCSGGTQVVRGFSPHAFCQIHMKCFNESCIPSRQWGFMSSAERVYGRVPKMDVTPMIYGCNVGGEKIRQKLIKAQQSYQEIPNINNRESDKIAISHRSNRTQMDVRDSRGLGAGACHVPLMHHITNIREENQNKQICTQKGRGYSDNTGRRALEADGAFRQHAHVHICGNPTQSRRMRGCGH